ncbi:MAG: hypothetical protein ABIN97_19545 [Ginsengibacter sp.]
MIFKDYITWNLPAMQSHFELYPTEQPLEIDASPTMIETLKKCYQMELAFPGKPYGPKDFKGSFSGLYKRGLLDIDISNKKLSSGRWHITTKGLQFLVLISTKRLPARDPFLINNINKLQQNFEKLQNSIYNLKVTSGRIAKHNF